MQRAKIAGVSQLSGSQLSGSQLSMLSGSQVLCFWFAERARQEVLWVAMSLCRGLAPPPCTPVRPQSTPDGARVTLGVPARKLENEPVPGARWKHGYVYLSNELSITSRSRGNLSGWPKD